jgi:hypothetical protein
MVSRKDYLFLGTSNRALTVCKAAEILCHRDGGRCNGSTRNPALQAGDLLQSLGEQEFGYYDLVRSWAQYRKGGYGLIRLLNTWPAWSFWKEWLPVVAAPSFARNACPGAAIAGSSDGACRSGIGKSFISSKKRKSGKIRYRRYFVRK